MNIGVRCRQEIVAAARLVHGDAVCRAGFMAIDQTVTNDELSEVTRARLRRIEKICLLDIRASGLCEGSSAVEWQCGSVIKEFAFRTAS